MLRSRWVKSICLGLLLFTGLQLFTLCKPRVPHAGEVGQGPAGIQEMTDPFEDFPKTVPHSCVNISQSRSHPEAWTYICVNEPKFNDIARELVQNEAWEPYLSEHLVQAMLNYPEAVLLDIGSNLGPHSLTVAGLGREVVVLDAVYYNLVLVSLSHMLTGKGKVRILYNSISDVRGDELYPYLEQHLAQQAGATHLVSRQALDGGWKTADGLQYSWKEVVGPPAVSVTTEDVLATISAKTVIIKIDIEGFECKALPSRVLDGSLEKFIPYILMEWGILRLNRHHACDQYSEFLQSFTVAGYTPHNAMSLQPELLENHKYWFEVVWVHNTAKPLPTSP